MTNFKSEPLFHLIKTLTKAEKRNFKLFANRTTSSKDVKFIKLFDVLDSLEEYDAKYILKKIPEIKKAQLSNMKAHLYKQILVSLRLNHINHNIDIQLRENIDYAKILYNKGLYNQSLKVLDKAKTHSIAHKFHSITLEIIEFEKLIESQYITRSISNRAEELTTQSQKLNEIIINSNKLSNLALRLYGLYIKMGYVRNEKDYGAVKKFMESNFPKIEKEELSFYERLYLYQSYVWYNYIIQDFVMCYKYAKKWVEIFHEFPNMLENQPTLYLKGIHNLLAALFNLGYYSKFKETLKKLEDLADNKTITANENIEILLFLYIYNNKINKHYLEGTFTLGLELVPDLITKIDKFSSKLDAHRVLVFYYKIACLYFGSGDNKTAIKYLEKVIKFKDVGLRGDIHCFARILNLIAHYEIEVNEALEYQIKSVYHFLGKMEDLHLVQKEIFKFLKSLSRITVSELKGEFIKLKDRLIEISQDKYERRPFLYLDIISWLESKISNQPVQKIIQEKFKYLK